MKQRFFVCVTFGWFAACVAGCGGGNASHLPKPRPHEDDEAPAAAVASAPTSAVPAVKPQLPNAPATPATVTPSAATPVLSETDRRKKVIDQLTRVGQALEAYRERNGSYPDRWCGPEKLSWRVALLPYLGQRDLYLKFQLREPWNGPRNQALLSQIPDVYKSPERQDEKTNFVLLTGRDTAYAVPEGLNEDRCPDGLANTILVAEVSDARAVPWTSPDDYAFDPLFEAESLQQDLFGLRKDCCYILLGGGGGPSRIAANMPDEQLLALLTPSGREPIMARNLVAPAHAIVDGVLIRTLQQEPMTRLAKRSPDAPKTNHGGPAAAANTPAADATNLAVRETPAARPVAARRPVPGPSEQERARAAFKSTFHDEYRGAKTTEAQRKLLVKLKEMAPEVQADGPSYYVLLDIVRQLAQQAARVEEAVWSVDELQRTFDVDGWQLKHEALKSFVNRSTADAKKVVELASKLADQAFEEQRYSQAKDVYVMAILQARRAHDLPLAEKLVSRRRQAELAVGSAESVERAMETLTHSPGDSHANLVLGKHLCFVKGDWENGLPVLAESGVKQFAILAQQDIARPRAAAACLRLADAWWDLGTNVTEGERPAVRQRAVYWYQRALPDLAAGFERVKVQKRIEQTSATRVAD